jgi:hypothetical protein
MTQKNRFVLALAELGGFSDYDSDLRGEHDAHWVYGVPLVGSRSSNPVSVHQRHAA